MDWAYPERAWAGQLEGPVIRTLWRAGRPISGRRVHEIGGVGAYSSIRAVLHKLVLHGIVHAERAGAAVMYSVNTEHLTYPALDAALRQVDVMTEFRHRIDSLVEQQMAAGLGQRPTVALFGSVARGEAHLDSDVDLLVVMDEPAAPGVEALVTDLSDRVAAWTGQSVHIFLTSTDRLREAAHAADPIITSFRADALYLSGPPVDWAAITA